MTRQQWIAATIGLEVRKAAEHADQPGVADDFDEHDHSNTRVVDVRWWLDGSLKGFERYTVMVPGDGVLFMFDDGPYVPDGHLPDRPCRLQVAAYPDGVDPTARGNIAVSGTNSHGRKLTAAEVEAAIDCSMGVHTWGTS